MKRYDARLDVVAAILNPPRRPAFCWVPVNDDVDAAVARFRVAHDWPDDGAHPVTVIRCYPGDLEL